MNDERALRLKGEEVAEGWMQNYSETEQEEFIEWLITFADKCELAITNKLTDEPHDLLTEWSES